MPPKLGIIAGSGELPGRIIETCRAKGRDFFVIAIQDQADPAVVDDVPHAWIRLGAAGQAVGHLHNAGCTELVLAGGVERPSFTALRPDRWAARLIAETRAFSFGDGELLRTLIKALEDKEGFEVVGIETLLPDLLATTGPYGRFSPDQQAEEDIETALRAALAIGELDIAQGAVAQLGDVLGVEDAKGTDALLKRVRGLRLPGPGGVLVKVCKPGQEQRVDLPTIGITTVEGAQRAGLRGIAVEAGGALVIDRDAVAEAADAAGLFVTGIVVEPLTGAKGAGPVPKASNANDPVVFVVAGEPSGDVLGARLMEELKTATKGKVAFAGVGGARMEEQGLKSLFPMSDLTVMGAAEVVPRLPRILARIRETVAAIGRARPAAVITIDAPDFNFRVAKRVAGKGIPLIHFVAPSVWAWRPGRARSVAGFLDHLLALLPFEPPYFEAEGLATTFVGHPVVESGADQGDGDAFRERHGIGDDETVIAVLPGSRPGEVARLGHVFGEALFLLKKKHPNLRAVVPTVDPVAPRVRAAAASWPVATTVVDGDREKYDAFAAADVALAASGTVALELAMAGVPTVIAYRVHPITAFIARRILKNRFVTLVNLVVDREVMPELIQESCRPDFLAATVEDLLVDTDRQADQQQAYGEALKALGLGGPSPAKRAAKAVLDVIGKKRRQSETAADG